MTPPFWTFPTFNHALPTGRVCETCQLLATVRINARVAFSGMTCAVTGPTGASGFPRTAPLQLADFGVPVPMSRQEEAT
ncbi:hypothetical protein [Mycolicibacterium sp. CR10]|uniref:hypothetical protein n=1 Tax=Mycolicibacterium sp. CR10 TaxID=2562314 RepID=UPI0010BFE0EA|nr:hypothetical protein [Mycolicibacterium sp. CR10]